MNRLAPLVDRTYRHPGRARVAAIGPAPASLSATASDLRLFVTTWLGGVVFFTTLLA
jgi:hypothetical protein